MFLNKYMPEVVAYLSYRIVDVSSVKELARRWYPKVGKRVPVQTHPLLVSVCGKHGRELWSPMLHQ
jgi:oligoribonuclease (3'-5' exoribonuclease)